MEQYFPNFNKEYTYIHELYFHTNCRVARKANSTEQHKKNKKETYSKIDIGISNMILEELHFSHI